MAINQGDIEFALYVLNQSIYTNQPLSTRDCALIKTFIEALLEHHQQPTENVKSRAWRAAVYRKLLDDPEALQQFTEQAIQKFGPERLSRMVAPQLQEMIVDNALQALSVPELTRLLKEHNRWADLLEYAIDQDEEWILEHFGLRARIDNAYDAGREEGASDSHEKYEEGYDAGFEEGRRAALEGE